MIVKLLLVSIIFNLASLAWIYKKVAVKVGMTFHIQLFVISSSIMFNVVLSIAVLRLWAYIIVGYMTLDMNSVWNDIANDYERLWTQKKWMK